MGTEAARFLVLWIAGWINSRQLEVIDFLREENRVLREQLGERRLRFTDDQRRRLAVSLRAAATRSSKRTVSRSRTGPETPRARRRMAVSGKHRAAVHLVARPRGPLAAHRLLGGEVHGP
jgi:hypothetical protein